MSSDYTLAYGTHANPDDGRCAMEWVSHLAGEPHSDQPKCVSPVLRAICIALNDSPRARAAPAPAPVPDPDDRHGRRWPRRGSLVDGDSTG